MKSLQKIFIIFTLFVSVNLYSQISINSLFKPGLRVGTIVQPEVAINDSVSVGSYTYLTNVIIPVNGKVKFNLSNLDIGGKQEFVTVNAGLQDLRFTDFNSNKLLYHFSLGFTGVRVTINDGFWVYQVKAGIINDITENRIISPYAYAGAAKVYIKGINKVNAFGLAIVYNGDRFLPIPIIGFRRKLASKLSMDVILPLEVDINFKATKKIKFVFKNMLSTSSSGISRNSFNSIVDQPNSKYTFNTLSLQTTLVGSYKFSNNFIIFAEGGINSYSRINVTETTSKNKISTYNKTLLPYFSLTARFNFGDFMFGSQIFGSDE